MARVREQPGSLALVSSVGGSFSKHAFAVYGTEPPAAGFQYADLDGEAAAQPRRAYAPGHDGDATVETYALRYSDGAASVASFSCLLDDGRRVWAKSADPALFEEMLARETCGRSARLEGSTLVAL
jgi:acetyl-CoA C-acetyltransferase